MLEKKIHEFFKEKLKSNQKLYKELSDPTSTSKEEGCKITTLWKESTYENVCVHQVSKQDRTDSVSTKKSTVRIRAPTLMRKPR